MARSSTIMTLGASVNDKLSSDLQARVMAIKDNVVDMAVKDAAKIVSPMVEEVLKEIVWMYFYEIVPESNYYDRLGLLMDSATVTVTQGGGYHKLNIYFDPKVLQKPTGYVPRQGTLYPYSKYTAGGTVVTLTESERLEVATRFNQTYGFTERLTEWLETKFTGVFKKELEARIKYYKKKA